MPNKTRVTRKGDGTFYWLESQVGDWIAAYRLAFDGRPLPVIAELRVFPAANRAGQPKGEWSGDAPIPGYGITAGLLRKQIRPALHLEHLKQLRAKVQQAAIDYWRERNEGAAPDRPSRRRGPAPRPDRFYAELARDYVTSVVAGSRHPAADLARSRGISRAMSRALVSQARLKGFLTPAMPGRPMGDLTDRAKSVLQQAATRAKTARRKLQRNGQP